MSKNIGIRVEENVSTKFEEIHVQLQSLTKGETFAKILEKYVLAEQTLVNTERLQQELTGANAKLADANTKLTADNTMLAEDNRLLTERNKELLNVQNVNVENSLQITALTEKIKELTDDNRLLTEKNETLSQKGDDRQSVPKWEAIAGAYVDVNADKFSSTGELLWHLFASYSKHNIDHGIKRPSNKIITEIENQFYN